MMEKNSKDCAVQFTKGADGVETGQIGITHSPITSNEEKMRNHCSATRFWMILAIAFMALSVGLSAYMVYDKEYTDGSNSANPGSNSVNPCWASPNETQILARYGTYFRSPAEQSTVEMSYGNVIAGSDKTKVPVDDSSPPRYCRYGCYNRTQCTQTSRRKRSPFQENVVVQSVVHSLVKRQSNSQSFHGCCVSTPGFVSPDQAETLDGQQVTIVQFDGQRQFFPSDQCSQANGCTGCTCAQEPALFNAVVRFEGNQNDQDDFEDVRLEFIRLPGCCKCFNNL